MKKVLILAACVVLAVAAIGCAKKGSSEKEDKIEMNETESTQVEEGSDQEYPQIVYIDNTLYYGTGEECVQVPRKMPEGTIETFYPKEIMPDAPNSANFGEDNESMEYMFLDDGQLIIHNGEAWFYFEKEAVE